MGNIDLDRVEKRYNIGDPKQLVAQLAHLGFEKKMFSNRPLTLTYFCDTSELSLPDDTRVKIRTYTDHVPDMINIEAPYKLNFKQHLEKSVSKKESFDGSFEKLLEIARVKTDLDIIPMMAMSYTRSHYIHPDISEIRITIDENVAFHKVENNKLIQFFDYNNIVLEIKYNPSSEKASVIIEELLSSIDHEISFSKKITMYEQYRAQQIT